MRDPRNKLARFAPLRTPVEVKLLRYLRACLGAVAVTVVVRAEVAEPVLPRPGAVLVVDVMGEATASTSDQRKAIKADDRLRVGSTITTRRLSLATLILSNGATLRIGSDSEVEIEEFGQATLSGSPKYAEMKAEPTISRTRLRLLRGDVIVDVKPLNVERGSSFLLTTAAGVLRIREGVIQATVEMSDLGLGVCTVELKRGTAEFEVLGGAFTPIPAGRKLAFALELDKSNGVMKVGEMPKPPAKNADAPQSK